MKRLKEIYQLSPIYFVHSNILTIDKEDNTINFANIHRKRNILVAFWLGPELLFAKHLACMTGTTLSNYIANRCTNSNEIVQIFMRFYNMINDISIFGNKN